MTRGIDWEAVAALEDSAQGIRKVLFPALSSRYVGGEGDNPEAFIIGEAPGAQEDMQGRPFVGPCRVVRDLMALADLRANFEPYLDQRRFPDNAWLTNLCKFRPPGNRNPSNAEVSAFRVLLQEEWHAVGAPSLIIPVGGIALSALFNRSMSILRAAGRNHQMRSAYTGQILNIWPMVHPAFGIRGGPQLQELIEQDWEKLGVWRNAKG